MSTYWLSALAPNFFGGMGRKIIEAEEIKAQVTTVIEPIEPQVTAATWPMESIEITSFESLINNYAKHLGLEDKQIKYITVACLSLALGHIAYRLSPSKENVLAYLKEQQKTLSRCFSFPSMFETLSKIEAGEITDRSKIIATCIKIANDKTCDDQQQVKAIRQLAKVGDLSKQDLESLAKALEGQSTLVKIEAALVLARYGELSDLAQEVLSEALKNPFLNDKSFKIPAAEVLIEQEKLSGKALSILEKYLSSPPPFLFSHQLAAVVFSHFDEKSIRIQCLQILENVLNLNGEISSEKDTVLPKQFQVVVINRLSREKDLNKSTLGKSILGMLRDLLAAPATSSLIKYHVSMALKNHKQPFFEQSQIALSKLLNSEDLDEAYKLDICQILVEQKELDNEAKEILSKHLGSSPLASPPLLVEQLAAAVLSQYIELSEADQILSSILEDHESHVMLKELAAKGLKKQPKLDSKEIRALTAALDGSSKLVNVNAALALGKHHENLLERAQVLLSEALTGQYLDNKDRVEAIKILMKQHELSEKTLSTLKDYLDVPHLTPAWKESAPHLISAWKEHFPKAGEPASLKQCIALIYGKHDKTLDVANQLILINISRERPKTDELNDLAHQILREQKILHDETISTLKKGSSIPEDLRSAIHTSQKDMLMEPTLFNRPRRSSLALSAGGSSLVSSRESSAPSSRRGSWAPSSRRDSVALDNL